MHQRVIHFEIPSDDPDKSIKFFEDVFGWEFRRFGEMEYWQAMTGDPKNPGIDGAIVKKNDGLSHVVNTIRVDDIDKMIIRIEKAGGKVMPKQEIPTVGWLAYFTDPDGNQHGIIEMETSSETQVGSQLLIERVFRAPRRLVWQHWSVPELVMKWWGPKHYTAPEAKIDFRVGGKYLFAMRSPEGQDFYSTGTYKEITPMEKIVATDSFSDKEGNIVPSSYYGMGSNTIDEYIVSIKLEDDGQKTKMTLEHRGLPADLVNMTKHGWEESLDKLDESLKE